MKTVVVLRTLSQIDWYSADIEFDVYCACGKHYVVYKREGDDSKNLVQCPKCFRCYKIISVVSVEYSDRYEGQLLEIDKNELPDWK